MVKLALDIGQEFWLKENFGIGVGGACPNPLFCIPNAYSSIGTFISAVLPNIYVIAGLLLFILLIIGGLMVIISAGKGEEEGVQKGSKTITSALIGFLIIFASYWIIQIIETITGLQIFKPNIP